MRFAAWFEAFEAERFSKAMDVRYISSAKTDLERIADGFDSVALGVREFGSALGAEDRYPGAGASLDARGNETIRAAFERVPELSQLLPRLNESIVRQADLAELGFEISAEMDEARARLGLPRRQRSA